MRRFRIELFTLLLFVPLAANAQNYLQNLRGRSSTQIANAAHGTRLDSSFFVARIGTNFRDVTRAILERGYSADDFASLAAAINQAESDTAMVIVAENHKTISATDTLHRTASLAVYKGGLINLSTGINFLIQGHFYAGRYKVFEGTGTVTFDNGSVDAISPEWWGAVGDSSTATLTSFNSAMSALSVGGNLELPDGTYSITDSINIAKPISVSGHTPPRRWGMTGSTRTTAIIGTDIRSSNNANGTGIRISSRGVNLSNLTVRGDATKTNGAGVRLAFTDATTTLGDNVLTNVHSAYNKLDGFRWECPDNSSMMIDCDANINRGYGVKVKPITGASGGTGINFTMIGGRTRRNGLGGLNLDTQLNSTIMNAGFIADTTYGVLLSGSAGQDIRTILMNVDAEQQVVKAGAFPATSLRIMNDSRQGLFMNNFLGVSSGVAGTTVRRRISLGGTVRSSVWINNGFSGVNTTTSDTAVVVEDGATVHALWIGDNGSSAAFDPIDSVDVLGSGVYRAAWIGIDHNNTGGEFRIKTNKETEFTVKGTAGDTLFINNVSGVVDVDGDAGLDLNASADGGITAFRNSASGENRTIRVYGDSAGTKRYVQLQVESSTGKAAFTHQTNQQIVMRSPLAIASTSYINFVARALPSTPASTNGVLSFKTDDRLWMKDDNGDSIQVAPYTGSATWNPGNLTSGSTDSTTVTVTNAEQGDAVICGLSTIGTANANLQLWGHVVSAGSVRVFIRNNSAGTYDVSSGTVKVRVWK